MTKKKESTKDLKKKVEALEKQNEEYVNGLKRLQAEFENFTSRTEREKQHLAAFATRLLANKLIIFMDDFERSLEAKGSLEDLKAGMDMIHKNFAKVLEEEGITPIDSLGKKLNPELHEVIKTEPSDESGTPRRISSSVIENLG